MSLPPKRPSRKSAAPRPAPSKTGTGTPDTAKGQLHPRNRHQGRYDFPALIKASPELAAFVINYTIHFPTLPNEKCFFV